MNRSIMQKVARQCYEEVTNLKWNDAAAKIKSVYEAVIEENKKQLK